MKYWTADILMSHLLDPSYNISTCINPSRLLAVAWPGSDSLLDNIVATPETAGRNRWKPFKVLRATGY